MKCTSALLAAAVVAACSAPLDTSKASAAVIEFHRLQAAGDDNRIYNDAAQQLRDTTRFEDWQRLDASVRAAMAQCEPAPATATSWNAFYGAGGARVSLVYQRDCSEGNLVETFVYLLDKDEVKLLGYNVSGLALLRAPSPPPPVTTTQPPASASPPPPTPPGTPT